MDSRLTDRNQRARGLPMFVRVQRFHIRVTPLINHDSIPYVGNSSFPQQYHSRHHQFHNYNPHHRHRFFGSADSFLNYQSTSVPASTSPSAGIIASSTNTTSNLHRSLNIFGGGTNSVHTNTSAADMRLMRLKNDTTALQKSDFYQITKTESNSIESNSRSDNLVQMLKKREHNAKSSFGFSNGEKCRLSNNYIPNKAMYNVGTRSSSNDGKLYCGLHSKNGNYFISCSQDKFIRLYDTSNGNFKLINTIIGRDVGWSILDAQFTDDNKHFVYSSWSPTIYLSTIDGDCDSQVAISLTPTASRFCLFSLAVTSDSRLVLGGSNDGHIYSYDLQADAQMLRIPAHRYDVNTIAFADPSSQLLYSGGDDGLINVWDIRTLSEPFPKPVGFLAGHVDGITYIDSRNDGRHLISNSKDQTIKLWDIRSFSSKATQTTCLNALNNMSWDYRWQEVPSLLHCANHKIDGDSSLMTYRGHVVVKTLIRCRFSPSFSTSQRYIYCGSGHGKAIIYDSLTGEIVRKLGRIQECIRDISWHPHRSEIVASSWSGGIIKWVYGSKIEDDRNSIATDSHYNYVKLRRSERIANILKERQQQQHQQLLEQVAQQSRRTTQHNSEDDSNRETQSPPTNTSSVVDAAANSPHP